VEDALRRLTPKEDPGGQSAAEKRLSEAMEYSLFAGGKRLRPILCLAAAAACGGGREAAAPVVCALELVHTYSLIHDDLPCMDDDDFRRGRPSNHKVFGEGLAVLAGDGLLTLAFSLIAESPLGTRPRLALAIIRELAGAAGPRGMIGGQAIDILGEGTAAAAATLERMHGLKTGALITAACRIGGLLAGADGSCLAALTDYGRLFGLAFQITDDLLDAEGDPAVTGKAARQDAALDKTTYVTVYGAAKARAMAEATVGRAKAALAGLPGDTGPLAALADYLTRRET
jgi:geranylgeranyl diphosphate synthase type II